MAGSALGPLTIGGAGRHTLLGNIEEEVRQAVQERGMQGPRSKSIAHLKSGAQQTP
jgi:hypothetical protein